MNNYRRYGNTPSKVVTVHGGPGALGDMGYVSEMLSSVCGVVEALQTKSSIGELIRELIDIIENECEEPVVLIGHSWGAWLAYMVAAERSNIVSKLVLIGSGPFSTEYVKEIESTRMERFDEDERGILEALIKDFYSEEVANKSELISKIGAMMENVDTFHHNGVDDEAYRVKVDGEMFNGIWSEASKLRSTGELLSIASRLECEVIVIHGEYDPHPFSGVIDPLDEKVEGIKTLLLPECGHSPWKEAYAHDDFFVILKDIVCERSS